MAPTWHAFLFFEYNDTSHFFRPVIAFGSVLFLRFELPDERSELRGDGAREGVVLVLEALPNRREHNASVPSRFALVFGLRGMSSEHQRQVAGAAQADRAQRDAGGGAS